MCDCGHRENQENIHSVSNYLDTKTIDLCDSCFLDASLVETVDSSLSSFQFPSIEDEKFITTQK